MLKDLHAHGFKAICWMAHMRCCIFEQNNFCFARQTSPRLLVRVQIKTTLTRTSRPAHWLKEAKGGNFEPL